MADDIHEIDCALLETKHDAIATADPRLEVVLVGKDWFQVAPSKITDARAGACS